MKKENGECLGYGISVLENQKSAKKALNEEHEKNEFVCQTSS